MKAMITGGSKGIGKEMAKEFLKHKYDVILVARNEKELLKTKKELENLYKDREVKIEAMDLILEENLLKLISRYPEVDILVNNAGMTKLDYSYSINEKIQSDGIKLNAQVPCFLSNFYIKKMIQNNNKNYFQGIINVSSLLGVLPSPLTNFYSPSKYLLDQYSYNLRYELKRKFKAKNINVMSLCPGAIDTGFIDETKFLKAKKICKKLKFLNILQKPEFVAKNAVSDFYKNKKRSTPGIFYKVSKFFIKFLPDFIIVKIMYDSMEKEIK